jgi:hypothetical protein
MTIDGFVKAFAREVRRTGDKWFVDEGGRLRRVLRTREYSLRVGRHCPLSWLGKSTTCSVADPSAKLGLTQSTGARIANAADNEFGPHDDALRKRLLVAAGL